MRIRKFLVDPKVMTWMQGLQGGFPMTERTPPWEDHGQPTINGVVTGVIVIYNGDV